MGPKFYQPKGGMCAACISSGETCEGLPFKTMPVIEVDGFTAVVKCTSFQRRYTTGPTTG
jgi:hypothetical protein